MRTSIFAITLLCVSSLSWGNEPQDRTDAPAASADDAEIPAEPRVALAIAGFSSEDKVEQAVSNLKKQGYEIKGNSAALIKGTYGDEGIDGLYFVSLYFFKKGEPGKEGKAQVITGTVRISAGHVIDTSVRILDSAKVEKAMEDLAASKEKPDRNSGADERPTQKLGNQKSLHER